MAILDEQRQSEFSARGYDFTTNNFIEHTPAWDKLLDFSSLTPCRAMEIGSHQGMSAVWLIENKLKSGDEFYVIDTWEYESEHDGTSKHEDKFDRNVKVALQRQPGIKLRKHKGKSTDVLPHFLAQGLRNSFDFIYVDGSHKAADVLEDLVLANLLCKVGGLIFCDDYLWWYNTPLSNTPKIAIDAFTNCFREKIEIIKHMPLFQIYLRKLQD